MQDLPLGWWPEQTVLHCHPNNSNGKNPNTINEIFFSLNQEKSNRISEVERDLRWYLVQHPVPSSSSYRIRPACPGICPIASWKPLRTETSQVLWETCSTALSSSQGKSFSSQSFPVGTSRFNSRLSPFVFPPHINLLDNLFIGKDRLLSGLPKVISSPGWTSPCLSLSSNTEFQPQTSWWPSTELAPGYQCLSHIRGPNWSSYMWSMECWVQGIITTLNPSACGPIHTNQKAVGLPCCQACCCSRSACCVPRPSKLLPREPVNSSLHCCTGYFLPRERLWICTS